MAERSTLNIDLINQSVLGLTVDTYNDQVGNPLAIEYSNLEWREISDQKTNFGICCLNPHPLEVKDISDKHLVYTSMKLMLLGATLQEDITKGQLTDDLFTDRSRTGFWLFSSLAILEITRRRHQGPINMDALFVVTDNLFKSKFGQVFEDRPIEEKIRIFKDAYDVAWNMVHENGFVTTGR